MANWVGWLETMQAGWPVALGLCFFLFLSVIVVWLLPRRRAAALSLSVGEDRRAELENEFRKTNAQILGGIFVLIGIYYTAEEISLTRNAENFKALSEAIKLLGASNPQKELGAVHILDQVAREDPRKHRAVLSILGSYIRQSTFREQRSADSLRVSETALRVIGELISEPDMDCTDAPVVDLSGADFTNLRLTAMDLSKMNLKEVVFRDAYLDQAVFTCSSLNGAVFDHADLRKASFYKSDLRDASFVKAQIDGVDFREADNWEPKQFSNSICGDPIQLPESIAELCGTGEVISAGDG